MTHQLPKNYRPFRSMVICTNELIDGQVPIAVKGRAIFLVGKGNPSTIWLNVPTGKKKIDDLRPVISANEILDTRAKIIASEQSVGVFWDGQQLLHIIAYPDSDKIEIPRIDLRPIGLAIVGDMQGLNVGTNKLVGNYMSGSTTLINVSG